MPIILSEILIEDDNWSIELSSYYYYFDEGDLGGQPFICSAGSTTLNEGIFLESEEILVISKADLVEPLNLNRNSDFVKLGEYGYFGEISWGEDDPYLQSPPEDHSIQVAVFSDHMPPDSNIWTQNYLDSQPTIGEDPYYCHSVATLEIQAYDINNSPLHNLRIDFGNESNPQTDINGLMNTDLGAKKYHLVGKYNDVAVWDSLVTLYPDSLYHFVIHTDVVSSDSDQINQPVYNISNSPNPFNPVTTISFGRVLEQPAKIKIYNSKGGLVDELDCSSGKESISWNAGTTASGVYFYKLEIEGSEVGKGKMLLLK